MPAVNAGSPPYEHGLGADELGSLISETTHCDSSLASKPLSQLIWTL
jgi:hypothetical protein